MSLNQIEKLARKLLHKHGLYHWGFAFHKGKVNFGLCDVTDKVIKISRHHAMSMESGFVKEILLHEIAHALCPSKEGHGKKWKETAKRIGATGESRYEIKGC